METTHTLAALRASLIRLANGMAASLPDLPEHVRQRAFNDLIAIWKTLEVLDRVAELPVIADSLNSLRESAN